MSVTPAWMVFDVESAGLSGEGFAVGWVVVARDGTEIDSGMRWCQLALASGREEGIAWVREHVVPALGVANLGNGLSSLVDLRAEFWSEWAVQRARGAVLAADVPWPVEANFLSACVRDNPRREVTQPYPLIDIASVRLAAGLDPLATLSRKANELPAHNPLADARQSARLLVEAMAKLGGDVSMATFSGKPDGCGHCVVCLGGDTWSQMVTCVTCGNKRCPKATNHALECSGSNEPGQAGSAYGPVSLPGADPTPAEALEWALEATPGAAEEFARAEVARLRAIEAKYAQFAAIVADLDMDHHAYCPRLGLSADVPATTSSTRCRCDLNARDALRKVAES